MHESLRLENEKRQAQRDFDLRLAAIEAEARAAERRTDYYPRYWPIRYGYPRRPRAERPNRNQPGNEPPAPEHHWRFRPPNLPPVRNHFPPNRTPAPSPPAQR